MDDPVLFHRSAYTVQDGKADGNVEIEFRSFEQAMMSFQLISDGSGKSMTVEEYVDEHRGEIRGGGLAGLLQIGSGK